jgi:RNA polymerase sigma-70 factor (ECF subfamily)
MTEMTPLPDAGSPAGRPPAIDWAAVLAAHDRWLRTVVRARLVERQAVDEVMQEIALAAVAQRAPLSDRARLGAWLYRLAVRQALLYRRRRGREHKLVGRYARVCCDSSEGTDPRAPAADPLDWLVLDERRTLVREALGRLARRDAEILLLKYTEGWSYRELADHMGVGEGAVEARLHRARGRLRDALARCAAIEVSE